MKKNAEVTTLNVQGINAKLYAGYKAAVIMNGHTLKEDIEFHMVKTAARFKARIKSLNVHSGRKGAVKP